MVGYQPELIVEAVRKHAINCEFIKNEDFATTNTIHSLWLARPVLKGDFLYFNGDVWFEPSVLSLLLEQTGSALAVDVKKCGDEEVKVTADFQGRITRIGKNLPPDEVLGEFIGVAKFERSACAPLVKTLRRLNEELGRKDCFFETALDGVLGQHEFLAAPLGQLKALEIDTPEDYAMAKALWKRLR